MFSSNGQNAQHESEGNMKLSREEIIERMGKLKDEEKLKFTVPEIFGGGIAIIGFNPEKGGKKYLLRLGEEGNETPYWPTNKAKELAKWVADRQGDLIEI
jgi:hypothetical protein